MPIVSIDIPTPAAVRLGIVLEAEGFTGTNAEKIAEVKRRMIYFLRQWVRQAEGDIASSAAWDNVPDLEVPYDEAATEAFDDGSSTPPGGSSKVAPPV